MSQVRVRIRLPRRQFGSPPDGLPADQSLSGGGGFESLHWKELSMCPGQSWEAQVSVSGRVRGGSGGITTLPT